MANLAAASPGPPAGTAPHQRGRDMRNGYAGNARRISTKPTGAGSRCAGPMGWTPSWEADLVVVPGIGQHLTREFCFVRLYFGLRGHSRVALPTDHSGRQEPAIETRHRHTLRMYSTVSSVVSANSPV
jgi:hypothetical protein